MNYNDFLERKTQSAGMHGFNSLWLPDFLFDYQKNTVQKNLFKHQTNYMENVIQLLKNNDHREYSDLEWINEFYQFLKGGRPGTIRLVRGHDPKMSEKKAFSIIYYLQEHFPLLPDYIERCNKCGELFDENNSGFYDEKKGKHYCDGCTPY